MKKRKKKGKEKKRKKQKEQSRSGPRSSSVMRLEKIITQIARLCYTLAQKAVYSSILLKSVETGF
jgi:hypothetical protein